MHIFKEEEDKPSKSSTDAHARGDLKNLIDHGKSIGNVNKTELKDLATKVANALLSAKELVDSEPGLAEAGIYSEGVAKQFQGMEAERHINDKHRGIFHGVGSMAGTVLHIAYMAKNRPEEWKRVEAELKVQINSLSQHREAKLMLACLSAILTIADEAFEFYKNADGSDIVDHLDTTIHEQLDTLVKDIEQRFKKK